jgi:hypothetical protein
LIDFCSFSDYFRGLLKDDKAMTLGELILKMQKVRQGYNLHTRQIAGKFVLQDKNIMTRGVRWVKELDPIVAKVVLFFHAMHTLIDWK